MVSCSIQFFFSKYHQIWLKIKFEFDKWKVKCQWPNLLAPTGKYHCPVLRLRARCGTSITWTRRSFIWKLPTFFLARRSNGPCASTTQSLQHKHRPLPCSFYLTRVGLKALLLGAYKFLEGKKVKPGIPILVIWSVLNFDLLRAICYFGLGATLLGKSSMFFTKDYFFGIIGIITCSDSIM